METVDELYVQLLGRARARIGSSWVHFAADKRHQLLGYLAYHGDWISRERLAYLFWPDTSSEAARRNLRSLLERVRGLGFASLEAERQRVRWPLKSDVAAFKQALEQGRLAEALSLYHGPLLEGLEGIEENEFLSWLEFEREHLHARWRETLLKRAKELEELSRHDEALGLLERLLRQDGMDEEALRLYMTMAMEAGRKEQALRAYRDFSRHLQRELGLEPTSMTQQLARQVEGLETPARPAPTATALPALATSFVGRNLELAEIAQLLSKPDCRLLTLTGPGGVGKSRIALQIAHTLRECYEGGSYFVALEALSSPEAIPASIAEALSIGLQGTDDALAQVIRHLKDKRLLLVLDGFEHLLDGAAVVVKLLQNCPRLKLLVASRERLSLAEEWLLPVEGLPFPSEGAATLESALSTDAVQLFLQRARRVSPGLKLTAENLPDVLTICRFVAGSPLALELAAVWARAMSPAEIAQEIQENVDILSTSARNIPERHKSIRATFEHSWSLLAPVEREVLRRLSVFRGGFRKEAAAVVGGASLAVLAALVDKSLLRVSTSGRYGRHPLLYGYAREKLAEHPHEAAHVQEKHAGYYFRLLREWGEGLKPGSERAEAGALEEELENILTAWRWAVAEGRVKELEQALPLLLRFFMRRGRRVPEAAEVFAQAVAGLNSSDPSHHRALGYALASQAHFLDEYDPKRVELLQASLGLLRPLKERRWIMSALYDLASTLHWLGNREEAKRYFQEALALAREGQDDTMVAHALTSLAHLTQNSGGYAETIRYAKEAVSLWHKLDSSGRVIGALMWVGLATLRMGKPKEAQAIIEQALQLTGKAGEEGYAPDTALLTAHLGLVAYALGDYDQARALHVEALGMVKENPDWQWVKPLFLADLGRIGIALGEYQEARDLFMRSLRIALPHKWLAHMLSALAGLAELQLRQGNLERALELAGLVLYHPATEHVHKEKIEQLVASLKDQLPAEVLAEGLARGKTMKLEEVVAEALGRAPADLAYVLAEDV